MALISPHRTGKANEDTSKILKSQSSIYIAGGNDRWSGQSTIVLDGDRNYKSVYTYSIISEPHCSKISQGADIYIESEIYDV